MKLYTLVVLSLSCWLCSNLPINAQVSVRAPYVSVDTGPGGVRVRAPFVNLNIPTSSPRYSKYPPIYPAQQRQIVVPQQPVFPSQPAPYQSQIPPQVPQVQPPLQQVPAPQVLPPKVQLPPKVIYQTPPMTHKKFATIFKPCAGQFEVDLIHPGICHKTVHVCFHLPPGRPCVRVGYRHIEFDYGNCSVEIVFAIFGKVRVEYH